AHRPPPRPARRAAAAGEAGARPGPRGASPSPPRGGARPPPPPAAGIEGASPATPAEPAEAPPGLAEAVGAAPRFVGRNRFDYLLELNSEAVVRGLRPDTRALAAVPVRGIIVTARSAAPAFDFVSRFFAPAAGVPEAPVTGSAHCCLGPFWARRLGKDEMTAYQASARGGVVGVRVAGQRVYLRGRAVTVLRGVLLAEKA